MNRFQLAALLLVISAGSSAVDTEDTDEPMSPVARHLQSMQSEAWPEPDMTMQGTVKFVTGNERWHTGEEFRIVNDWLALSCKPAGCELEAATLNVQPELRQGHYDDQPTIGQLLSFKRQRAQSSGEVVAWFNMADAPPWLKLGAVPTYYAPPFPLKQPKSPGSLEVEINQPKGGAVRLVPMKLAADSDLAMGSNSDSYLLQLRASNKRQLLLGHLGACYGNIEPRKFLQWSGDLDRDGTPDYLISFIDQDGPVHLYLSSHARPGQLVGLAGVYKSPSSDAECAEQ